MINWMSEAIDTLDVVLTYGDADDPLFARILTRYRDLARDQGQAERFECLLHDLLALKSRPYAGNRAAAG